MANLSKPQFSQEFANHEIAVVALFLLGGRSGSIETEDVAVQMNILAPGRFNWRKYKDQIDIDNIRSSLRDAKKKRNGALVSGSEKEGWRLTQSGLAFLEASGSISILQTSPVSAWVVRKSPGPGESGTDFCTSRPS